MKILSKSKMTNHRWSEDLKGYSERPRASNTPVRYTDYAFDNEEAFTVAREEKWGYELEQRQRPSFRTIGPLLDDTWDHLTPLTNEIMVTTLDLCKLYAPLFASILRHKVREGNGQAVLDYCDD